MAGVPVLGALRDGTARRAWGLGGAAVGAASCRCRFSPLRGQVPLPGHGEPGPSGAVRWAPQLKTARGDFFNEANGVRGGAVSETVRCRPGGGEGIAAHQSMDCLGCGTAKLLRAQIVYLNLCVCL